jgi:hypothetical protein
MNHTNNFLMKAVFVKKIANNLNYNYGNFYLKFSCTIFENTIVKKNESLIFFRFDI